MASGNGPDGFYFKLAANLFTGDKLSPREVSTLIALCHAACMSSTTGIFQLSETAVIESIKAADFDGKAPSPSKLKQAIRDLVKHQCIEDCGKGYIWIKDYWAFRQEHPNPNQCIGAYDSLSNHSEGLRKAFMQHYTKAFREALAAAEAGMAKAKREGRGTDALEKARARLEGILEPFGKPSTNDCPSNINTNINTNISNQSPPPTAAGEGQGLDQDERKPKPVTFDTVGKRFKEIQAQLVADGKIIVDPSRDRTWQAIRSGANRGVTVAETCLLALEWAAQNDPFWREQFANPASFDTGKRWCDLVNRYLSRAQREPSNAPPSPLRKIASLEEFEACLPTKKS